MAGDKEVTDHKSKLWRIKDGDILKRVEDIYIYIEIYIYNYEEERFGFFREFWKLFCFWG